VADLEVHVIAPERRLWRGKATSVVAPAAMGEIGILPKHEPVLALMRAGTVRVHPKGGEKLEFHIEDGLLSVDGDVVMILVHTRQATPAAH